MLMLPCSHTDPSALQRVGCEPDILGHLHNIFFYIIYYFPLPLSHSHTFGVIYYSSLPLPPTSIMSLSLLLDMRKKCAPPIQLAGVGVGFPRMKAASMALA
jgi:hypothetical protein